MFFVSMLVTESLTNLVNATVVVLGIILVILTVLNISNKD